ncbi:penicillin-binding transpeptidase domain-containing protein [Neobacillus sp. DY30]|uniref:penicillin-binding transpeptidase domain-containing protein n=1 Tax=Neobacillus sp. DY30 TaxID=3047871 RepID=UPI0024C0DACD|nr:penicillin-binding transpeptidase domain-containing protein [Neobacillus sp. DY30]WHY00506.1 penicillin-binding transpeptidase domain-containing protein [Neobacillus sp. DY30]
MKKIIGLLLMLVLFAVAAAGCSKEPTPQDRFDAYIKLWNEQKFDKMYDYLTEGSKEVISKEDFTSRYQKIYDDLQITDLKMTFNKPGEEELAKDEDTVTYDFSASMNSIAGEIQFTHKAKMKKEERDKKNNWYVDWNTTYIFPQLKDGDKIGISSVKPKRGQIFDRADNTLAYNGQVYEVGVVPGKMEGQEGPVIAQLSSLLKMTPEQINKALTANWVKPDLFVPLKKVSMDDQERIAQLIALEPVQTKKVEARLYPFKETAAHLIGYVGSITADELEKLKDKGYTSTDIIGKRGLEEVFDEQLKGKSGVKITIKKPDGKSEVLAEKPVEDGQDLKLTIDIELQIKIYNELAGEAGTGAAINPVTGETLALVSTPSFDPNQAVLGFSTLEWNELQENPQKPLTTRFNKAYAPGSVFKPLTASIGLKNNMITPEQTMDIKGLKWQKGASWGNYFITRVHEANPVNLEKALVYSDNIYFARTALEIGKDTFSAGLREFGFEEELDYPFPLEKSTIGNLDKDIALADSGYGQGQIQMSIVHLLQTYTPFVNGGNMIKPSLLLGGEKTEKAVSSPEIAAILSSQLRKVVGDSEGTAHSADMADYPLAGKTGTAEIKQKQGEKGTENGWFIAYNTNSPNLMVAMMVENVLDRGGSQIPVKKVKNVITELK